MKQRGFLGMEVSWTVEHTQRDVPHVHAAVKGVDHTIEFSQAVRKVWGRDTWDDPIYNADGWLSYMFKNTRSFTRLQRHLLSNGERVEHHSRQYLGTTSLKAALAADESHSPNWRVVVTRQAE